MEIVTAWAVAGSCRSQLLGWLVLSAVILPSWGTWPR